jgi:acetoin utilization deacetylase AcuC-like enzyme
MKVFFSDQMVANSASFSPSAGKPAQAVASWIEAGFDIEIAVPDPVTVEQLCLAHDRDFVHNILSCRISNGFGNKNKDVADSLPHTTGAMLAAAQHAIATGGFSCAPVSGFHHAGWDYAGGYCTFNGLMVTAMSLLKDGLAKKVGILDCDQHYGNGTDDIINKLGVSNVVHHHSVGEKSIKPNTFFDKLSLLAKSFSDCDVLLYQAGADPHIDDPLGGWLTTEQLRVRDRIVFETARDIGLPVAWNLAGGYMRDKRGTIRPVLDIHNNTMSECLLLA